MHCFREDHNIARIINDARSRAHIKYGDNSIEMIPATDIGKWLAILLGEEYGEVCRTLNYDQDLATLPDELVDVLAIASAWLDACIREGMRPSKLPWLASD